MVSWFLKVILAVGHILHENNYSFQFSNADSYAMRLTNSTNSFYMCWIVKTSGYQMDLNQDTSSRESYLWAVTAATFVFVVVVVTAAVVSHELVGG